MPTSGEDFDGYRIQGELGRGGMGVVYLAEQVNLGREVALKVIAPVLAQDPLFRRRFEREARLAASLEHPNVVPVFDFGAAHGRLYLAMRKVDGSDLAGLLRAERRLPPEHVLNVIEQTASALDAAHARGLVHRDVKPQNILLERGDPRGHVYLTDFGLTKETASQSQLTDTGNWMGTVDYVAPEQVQGGRVDARADVYSLTCVLFHALSGVLPFQGTDVQKIWARMQGDVPSIASVDPGSSSFEPVIERGLAIDRNGRYPSAGDLARAARAAMVGAANTQPERSVATGQAATGVLDPEEPQEDRIATRPIATSPASPRRRAGTGNRVWIGAGIAAAVAAIAAAAVVVLGQIGDSGQDAVTTTVQSEPPAAAGTPSGPEAGSGGGERAESSAELSAVPARYQLYIASDPDYFYHAELPAGNGWSKPIESRPTGGDLLRTTVRGPDGALLIIDRTPNEIPSIGGNYESTREVPHPEFGTATEYILSESESIPECAGRQCVDYLIEDGAGGGWGVLGGGPSLPLATEVAARVAKSISATDI
jgi:predicted Ser/Thr protein kinase